MYSFDSKIPLPIHENSIYCLVSFYELIVLCLSCILILYFALSLVRSKISKLSICLIPDFNDLKISEFSLDNYLVYINKFKKTIPLSHKIIYLSETFITSLLGSICFLTLVSIAEFFFYNYLPCSKIEYQSIFNIFYNYSNPKNDIESIIHNKIIKIMIDGKVTKYEYFSIFRAYSKM